MSDQRLPHDLPESEETDAIIELTDIVPSPDSEDIIELTDVVEERMSEDEAVIELTDVVSASAEEAPFRTASPADEPVIDLTDVVIDEAEDETRPDALDPIEDEPAEASMENGEASTSAELEFADMELDIEERKEEGLFDSLGMNMEAELLQAEGETGELDFNLSTQELSDAIDLLDAKLAEEPRQTPPADADRASPPASIAAEQLEAALENVIRKMLGEKIDRLLNEAIERTVSAEIARLKDQLLGEDADRS